MKDKDLARLDTWRLAWDSFRKEPLGTGPDTFGRTYLKDRTTAMLAHNGGHGGDMIQNHAHNLPLQVLSTIGILGLLAGMQVLRGIRRPQTRHEAAVFLAILSLGLNLMVNPTSLEVMCIGAYLLGSMAHSRKDASVMWPVRAALLLPLLVALAYTVTEFVPSLQRQNPCEVEYAARISRSVGMAIVQRPKEKGYILSYGEQLAKETLACRPNNPTARAVQASISWYGAVLGAHGRIEQADRDIDAALQLDPYNTQLTEMRQSLDKIKNP